MHRFVNGCAGLFIFLTMLIFSPETTPARESGEPRNLTVKAVIGHQPGEKITLHHQMLRYVEEVARLSPRVLYRVQGHSWEGRELVLVIVSDPQNLERLDAIRENAGKLGDPRHLSPEELEAIIQNQPVIVWLGGSIHGFELSGSEAILRLLEYFVTHDDEQTRQILKNVVILLDPMLNPDGRDAFARYNQATTARVPNPDRRDWNNDFTRWEALQYRTGHYFFDTNRDWFAHTQKETRARIPTLLTWRPQVVLDLHEMGSDVEFYFDPAAEPYGPFFPPFARAWFERFNKAYARVFDANRYEYMTRERYNYFYPGYTTSYNSYQGSVGMLFEQGSTRGLTIMRSDETVRHLREAVEHHFVGALEAVRFSARNRESLLRDYVQALKRDIEEGKKGYIVYFLPPGGDPGLQRELIAMLLRNGIEVQRLTRGIQLSEARDRNGQAVKGIKLPAGTYVIYSTQPRMRLIRVLLEPDVPLPKAFLKEARKRAERAENPRFYDITAWSLPLLFNQPAFSVRKVPRIEVEPVTMATLQEGYLAPSPAEYAYLVDGRQVYGMSVAYTLRHQGFRVGILTRPTVIQGRAYSGGTVIIQLNRASSSVHEKISEVARRFGVEITPVNTGLAEGQNPSLGSGEIVWIKPVRIAMLAEDPVNAYSFGWTWYTLTEQYQIPVTVIRVRSFARQNLHDFDVIVLPDLTAGDMKNTLGEKGIQHLKQWISDGGVLVALGEASEFVRKVLELKIRSWYDEEANKKAMPWSVPGGIARVHLDPDGWLTSGNDPVIPAFVDSSRIFLSPDEPASSKWRVFARYAPKPRLRIAGYFWPESLERLDGAVYIFEERVGEGRVILFAEDVNFRAYWRGLNRLFLNAVLMGPTAP